MGPNGHYRQFSVCLDIFKLTALSFDNIICGVVLSKLFKDNIKWIKQVRKFYAVDRIKYGRPISFLTLIFISCATSNISANRCFM